MVEKFIKSLSLSHTHARVRTHTHTLMSTLKAFYHISSLKDKYSILTFYQITRLVTRALELLEVPEEPWLSQIWFLYKQVSPIKFLNIFLQQKWVTTLDCMGKKVSCFMKITLVTFWIFCLHLAWFTQLILILIFKQGCRRPVSQNRTMTKMILIHMTASCT